MNHALVALCHMCSPESPHADPRGARQHCILHLLRFCALPSDYLWYFNSLVVFAVGFMIDCKTQRFNNKFLLE